VRAIVIYESKYGNTRLVAEKIAEGMNQVSGVQAASADYKDASAKRLGEYEVIVIGSPNHMGGPTSSIRKLIDGMAKESLQNKYGAVFDTYMGAEFEKAVKKMEKQVNEKLPGLRLIAQGLSVKVEAMKGPLSPGETGRAVEFGIAIATSAREK
jgi:flavorubredoxin